MAATAGLTEVVLYDTLVKLGLVSMARTVEGAMNRALDATLGSKIPNVGSPRGVFLLSPINEMELFIDEHAIRLLPGLLYGR